MCPDEIDEATNGPVNVWTIMSKVRLEAMMWGAGTALGELPPYFMARAARLSTIGVKEKSGRKDSSMQLSDEMAEIEELRRRRDMHERMVYKFKHFIIIYNRHIILLLHFNSLVFPR